MATGRKKDGYRYQNLSDQVSLTPRKPRKPYKGQSIKPQKCSQGSISYRFQTAPPTGQSSQTHKSMGDICHSSHHHSVPL